MESIIQFLTHEYVIAFYGVVMWSLTELSSHLYSLQKITLQEVINFYRKDIIIMGRSMIFVGFLVVFDDELLARYNAFMVVDYHEMTWQMYFGLGFIIEFIISKFFTKR